MDFLFHLFNHNFGGIRSLEDVVGIMGHQLRALGHTAVYDPANNVKPDLSYNIRFYTHPNSCNVIVEGFTPQTIEVLADIKSKGGRIICLATEEPTERGFNHGLSIEMRQRQETFAEASRYLDGILHLVPGAPITEWFGRYAPAAQAELGYAPNLVRLESELDPPHDFAFFGTLSPRRVKLINRLIRRIGDKRRFLLVRNLPPQIERDWLTQRAKVVITLRKAEEMGLVSSSRCNTALHCGRPVIAEPHDLSKPWDEVVTFAPNEDEFFELALEARKVWRPLHAHQFKRMKTLLTPEYCVGEPLRRIGILDRRVAA